MTQQFAFHQQPRCPLCQANLVQGCWDARGGVVFCHTCAVTVAVGTRVTSRSQLSNPIIAFLLWYIQARPGKHWTETAGLHFYTPNPLATREAAAHLDPWHGDQPRHDSLTLGYEADAADFQSPPVFAPCQRDYAEREQ